MPQDVFVVSLPPETDEAEREALEGELKEVDEVEDAGPSDLKSIDAATIEAWVQVATGVLTVATTAIPLIKAVVGRIRNRGIRGATIELPNGVKISVDGASSEEIERLVRAATQGSEG